MPIYRIAGLSSHVGHRSFTGVLYNLHSIAFSPHIQIVLDILDGGSIQTGLGAVAHVDS